jgi:hypothetical protein
VTVEVTVTMTVELIVVVTVSSTFIFQGSKTRQEKGVVASF